MAMNAVSVWALAGAIADLVLRVCFWRMQGRDCESAPDLAPPTASPFVRAIYVSCVYGAVAPSWMREKEGERGTVAVGVTVTHWQ